MVYIFYVCMYIIHNLHRLQAVHGNMNENNAVAFWTLYFYAQTRSYVSNTLYSMYDWFESENVNELVELEYVLDRNMTEIQNWGVLLVFISYNITLHEWDTDTVYKYHFYIPHQNDNFLQMHCL